MAAAALTVTAAGAVDTGQPTAAASEQKSAPRAGGPPLGTSAYGTATPPGAPSATAPTLAPSSLQERAAGQRQADVERLRAEERRRAELERRRAQERAQARAKARAQAAREAAERARKARAAAEARAARARRAARQWVAPVSGYRISARFGQGGSLWSHRHTGLDFAAPSGNVVRSVGTGVVESAGWAGAYGNRVVIRHRDGTRTSYSHLSRITRRSGTVKAGTAIGRVGTTGNSTGPHLHLEVRPGGGSPVDPARWLERRGVRL